MTAGPVGGGEDAEAVRAFFDQWDLYRKIRDLDYLHHRAAYEAIAEELRAAGEGFSFLDLGAGDAERTAQALVGTDLRLYEAVDLSPVALELAKQNVAKLPGEKRFVVGDFVDRVAAGGGPFDVVFIGLSLHHLPAPQKRSFLRAARLLVRSGGRLICYEPILRPNETRDEVMARWWEFAQARWIDLEDDERERARAHIFASDYPESVDGYRRMLAEAGFATSRVIFSSPDDFYAAISTAA